MDVDAPQCGMLKEKKLTKVYAVGENVQTEKKQCMVIFRISVTDKILLNDENAFWNIHE